MHTGPAFESQMTNLALVPHEMVSDWHRRANGAGQGAIAAAKVFGHRKQGLPRGQDDGLFLGHLKNSKRVMQERALQYWEGEHARKVTF